ncbi:MAG: hypothetical protein Kow0059_00180 [Candidatus Sumerlaeia bacterium]
MDRSFLLPAWLENDLLDRYPVFAREAGFWGGRFHPLAPYPSMAFGLWTINLVVGLVLPPNPLYLLVAPLLGLYHLIYYLRFRIYWRRGRLEELLSLPVWAPSLLTQIVLPWRILQNSFYVFFVLNWVAKFTAGVVENVVMDVVVWDGLLVGSVWIFAVAHSLRQFGNAGFWSSLGEPGWIWQALFLGARRPSVVVRFAALRILMIVIRVLTAAAIVHTGVMLYLTTVNDPGSFAIYTLLGLAVSYLLVRVSGWLGFQARRLSEFEQETWTVFLAR